MRNSIGIFVLLVSSFIAGCGKPGPPGTGVSAPHAARIPEGLNERHAANFLAAAKDLQKTGEPKQAVAILKELIGKYPDSDAADEAKQILDQLEKSNVDAAENEDGGAVLDPDRDKAEKFLHALPDVESVEEEKKLLTEFGAWLRENEYKLSVTMIDGKHDLSCPYFPPETPWVRHSFLDDSNLELLPQIESEG